MKNGKVSKVRGKGKRKPAPDIDAVEPKEGILSSLQVDDDNDGIGPSGIAWHNVKRRVGDLKGWDRNPRRLTDSQAKHLATSIIKFGYVEPVAVNADNVIIGGHMRQLIMLQAELINSDTMIDVRIPSRPLEEDEVAELNVRLNKNTGDWDWDVLSANFEQSSLREWGFSPMDFGVGATQGADLTPVTPVAPEPLKPTNLKPHAPRICVHCEEPCHCVVEEKA